MNKCTTGVLGMTRWMCGVTKMDRNERNRQTTNVGETFKKVRERRLLKWYGHFMRRDKEYVAERVIRMEEEICLFNIVCRYTNSAI